MVAFRVQQRPTICQLLHGLRIGGAEVLVTRLARALSDRYRFVFACLDEIGTLGEELQRDGFPVHSLDRRPGFDWHCSVRLANLLRRERIDLVQAHQYTPFFYGMTARWLCHQPPILFTEHGRWFPDYPKRKRIIANRLLLSPRDRVVGVGEAVRKALIQNEGIPASRVRVIYNGIDSKGAARQSVRDQVRAELGIQTDDLAIMQVARLDPLKDHLTALRTLEAVLPRFPKAKLIFVGEGPQRPFIEAAIRERRLQHAVTMLGLRTDVARLLAGADVFMLTSISEGIPVTLIEAMAAGVPIVATDVGGVAETVVDGASALLAPAGDFNRLSQHLAHLAADQDLRHNLIAAGRERARSMFSETQMHARYVDLFEEMLRG